MDHDFFNRVRTAGASGRGGEFPLPDFAGGNPHERFSPRLPPRPNLGLGCITVSNDVRYRTVTDKRLLELSPERAACTGFGNTFTTTSSCPSRNSLASARTLSTVRLAVSCWLSFK